MTERPDLDISRGPADSPASPVAVAPGSPAAVSGHAQGRTLAGVSEDLQAGAAIVTIAMAAEKAAAGLLRDILGCLRSAALPGASRILIQNEIELHRAGLRALADAASVNGVNLLVHPAGLSVSSDVSIVAALARSASGDVSVSAIDVDRNVTALFGVAARRGIADAPHPETGISVETIAVAALEDKDVDQTILDRYIQHVDAAIIRVNAAASHLSIARSRINLQKSFMSSLADALAGEPAAPAESGLNQDSVRQTALATRRLLENQSHSIANRNSQTVIKLFRGS